MQRLAALPQPGFIDDTEHWSTVTFDRDQEIPEEHVQRVVFDSGSRRECVMGVPFDPKGFLIIGDSYFAPDTWLLRKRATPVRTTTAPAGPNVPDMAPDLSDLKVIANVVSVAKSSYKTRLLGTVALTHGGTAYHISLAPLSNPVVHNLRELWIDTATFDIMRAVIEGNYRPTQDSLLERTFVQEDFGQVGPYRLVIHHVWTYTPAFSRVKTQYNVTSVQMRFPSTVPPWFFDERRFRSHVNEVPAALEWTGHRK